jgi:hypothetical protein
MEQRETCIYAMYIQGKRTYISQIGHNPHAHCHQHYAPTPSPSSQDHTIPYLNNPKAAWKVCCPFSNTAFLASKFSRLRVVSSGSAATNATSSSVMSLTSMGEMVSLARSRRR